MKKLQLPILVVMLLLGYMLYSSIVIFDDYHRLNGTGVPVSVRITREKKDVKRNHDDVPYGETRYRLYGEYEYQGKTYSNVFVGYSYFSGKTGTTYTVQIDPQKPWKKAPESDGIFLMVLAVGLFSCVGAMGVRSFAEKMVEDEAAAARDACCRAARRTVYLILAGGLLGLGLIYSVLCKTVTALIAAICVLATMALIGFIMGRKGGKHERRSMPKPEAKMKELV